MINNHAAYRALTSRDPRFDGIFFVGVASTGVYCRPICPVKTPLQKNCRFFESAFAAEKASFRSCLRCRPELAPGHAPIDNSNRVAHLITRRIDEGLIDEGARLEELAAEFGISSRQLRRIVQKELGVSPIELMQTRRLLLAKQLLTETKLPITEIAFASGFSSLRRFNDAFGTHYRMPPSHLRKRAAEHHEAIDAGRTSTLQLSYRPPYDWQEILKFLGARMIRDVEFVTADSYARTVQLGKRTGWINVTHVPEKRGLVVEFTHTLTPVLPALLGRLRNLFDLAARSAHCQSQRRRHREARNREDARGEHPCFGAGIPSRLVKTRCRSQSRRRHRAANRAAGNRPMDGALHRHARFALAGCFSERRHCGAQQPWPSQYETSGTNFPSLASMA